MAHHRPKDILELISRTETHTMGCARPAIAQRFRKMGIWLVRQAYLRRWLCGGPGAHAKSLPGLGWGTSLQRWKGIWHWICSPRINGPSCADAICVKSHARSFYLANERPWSTKALLSDGRRTIEDLSNEVEIRRKLALWQCVNVPALLDYQLRTDPPFLCDEIVWGRQCHAHDAAIVKKEFLPQFEAMYRRHGIAWKTAAEVLAPDHLMLKIGRAAKMVQWNPRWGSRTEFQSEILKQLALGGLLPCSLGHGDLALNNLLVAQDGQLFVLDWERAAEQPIAFDLHRLARHLPGFVGEIEGVLTRLKPPSPAIPVQSKQQLFFAAIATIAQHTPESTSPVTERQRARLRSRFQDASDLLTNSR